MESKTWRKILDPIRQCMTNKQVERINPIPEEKSQDVVDDVREPSQKAKPRFKPEDLYYDMSGEKFLVIFNHFQYKSTKYYRFDPPKQRNGTEQDVKSLKYVFGSLGFKILTYTDLEHDEITDMVARISKQDHSRTSCLAVAIMTHGDKNGELYAADRTYLLKDITVMLENGHPTLVNKPKLFFIQACRGDLADAGRRVQYDGDEESTITVPSHSDFFFMYSTVEDHLSWRDAGGSWMIQELCEVLKTYHEDYDLLHLVTIATRNVAYARASNTPSNRKTHNKKQTPEARFTLTKLVKF